MLSDITSKFWSESVWLPPNVTWETIANRNNGVNYAQFNDLYYSFFTAAAFLVIRFIIEKLVFAPIGSFFGLKERRLTIADQPLLEKIYRKSKTDISQQEVESVSKKLDLTEEEIRQWLDQRAILSKPSKLTKFTETCWRFTFYTFAFTYGFWSLSNEPWTWDSMYCFLDFPHHSVSNKIWWYYNFELGFYLSLVVSQFSDVKRNDFWQMFIHHIVTCALMAFSWACNLFRIGSLVLIIHDFADVPLEAAKLAHYLKVSSVGNVIFGIFIICWIYSRLGLLPLRVLSYSMWHGLEVVPMFPAYYIFNGLLCVLQILHIIWTWLILRIAYYALFVDGEYKDLRESDSEDDEIVAEATKTDNQEKAHLNGNGKVARDSTEEIGGDSNGAL